MIYNLNNEADRQPFREFGKKLMDKRCVVELKERKPKRSIPQNSYLHFCLAYFASEFGYGLEEVKYDIYKRMVNKDIYTRVRKNRRGQDVVYMRSSRDLDTNEMSITIDRFRNYSMNAAGLYIPEPHEEDAFVEAEKQIAEFERYL